MRRYTFHQGDICDEDLSTVFEASAPDAVFHLAAQTSVVRSARDPVRDARVNVLGTLHVLQQAIAHGVQRFIFSSTGGALYGNPARLPATETLPPRPTSPYGASKLAAEAYLAALCPLAGIRYTALRYGNVYGPRQDPFGEAGVVAIFAQAMLRGARPVIFGDGSQERDYVFVSDVVEANLLALEARTDTICNIGTGEGISVRQVFDAVAAEANYQGNPAHAAERPGEVRRVHLDAGLAARELGWKPRVSFPEGIRRTVLSFLGEEIGTIASPGM